MYGVKKYFGLLDNMFAKNIGEFIKLIPTCSQFSKEDVKIIYKALYKATSLHDGQKRKNKDPYITHPISVASLLANLGFDFETVAAALLHDTIEDTNYTLSDCERDFGPAITKIVDGVTKIGNDVNTQTHDKILRATLDDPRIMAVKAADRLHNMYTLDALSPSKQIEISTETDVFYVPIAKILGIYRLKDELQDLCLYYLNKESFVHIYEQRKNLKLKYNKTLDELGCKTQVSLSKKGIAMSYKYRIKNVGGIYEDLHNNNDILSDLLAIKMVLDDNNMCYETLGIVHNISKPLDGGFMDFIGAPKNNGYRSLNTNVLYKDANIQVRIRTDEMQKTNDMGIFSDLNLDVKNRLSKDMKKELDKLSKRK